MRSRFDLRLTLPAVSLLALWLAAAPAWAQFAGKRSGGFGRGGNVPITVSAQFAAAKDGKPDRLFVTAVIQQGWHVYSTSQQPPPQKTVIELAPSKAFWLLGDFRPHPAPETIQEDAFPEVRSEIHEGTVVWYAPIAIAAGVDPRTVKIDGKLKVQLCDAGSCQLQEPSFTAGLGPGIDVPQTAAPAAAAAPSSPRFNPEAIKKHLAGEDEGTSLWLHLALGFVGGILLNLMPCVLPVIGLKILSFVEQSGHDRKTGFLLNVWYSLGLVAVFWVLAGLAIGLKWGSGQFFQHPEFNIFIAALVFSMALAFLGVWEFPVPGFAGRGRALELAQREGAIGAVFKGALTTVLATPCLGPFMGVALGWAVKQPPAAALAVFTSVGLGMASPYLLIGAFPQLIRFLPKPGAWMETFKQIVGFVLLGTVVFVFTFLETSYIVPTVGLLFTLWLACWWISRTPPTAELPAKARSWVEAAAIVGLGWLLLFPGIDEMLPERFSGWGRGLHDVMQGRLDERIATAAGQPRQTKQSPDELPWQPFTTRPAFERLLNSGKTVLVDFTADWCGTCKYLESVSLNTRPIRELVRKNGVVTLKADWTHEDPEVTAMLDLLGSNGVPVVAIFPAGRPNEPIRFIGGYTQAKVLDALEKAGPSKPSAPSAKTSPAGSL